MEQIMDAVPAKIYNEDYDFNISLEEMKEWIQRDPDGLSKDHGDVYGRLPLHVACEIKAFSNDIMFWLIDSYPKAVSIQDGGKNLPLHSYLDDNDDLIEPPVLLRLIELHPAGLESKNGSEQLPLHLACSSHAHNEILRFLVERNPGGCMVRDEAGNLPLHHLCSGGVPENLQGIELLIDTFPQSLLLRNEKGNLPVELVLTTLSTYCGKTQVLGLLIDKQPHSLHSKDENGCLPLHKACCSDKNSHEALKLLLEQYPFGACVSNYSDELPLHCYVNTRNNPSIDTIRLFVHRNPEALLAFDKRGLLPLESFVNGPKRSWNIVAESFRFLLTSSHQALWKKDRLGRLSLHRLCQKGHLVQLEALRAMLDAYPESSKVLDRLGNLPLFYLCENKFFMCGDKALSESRSLSTLNSIYFLVKRMLPFFVCRRAHRLGTVETVAHKKRRFT